MRIEVELRDRAFDPSAETESVRRGNPRIGGVVSFLGLMRDLNEGEAVQAMYLEHYPGMTERALQEIVAEAGERWELEGLKVLHRIGEVRPEEPIVLVAVAARHRGEAFRACEFVIDYLKTRAPFWKKETTGDGERWVSRRSSDREAERRWIDPGTDPQEDRLDGDRQDASVDDKAS
jgi:molybdopterin synthase catalytic subunit